MKQIAYNKTGFAYSLLMTNLHLTNQKSLIQLFCYGFIGVGSNLIAYLVYLSFTYFGATPKITMSLLYGVSVMASFWGNRKFTFAYKGNSLKPLMLYFIAHGFGYLINFTMMIIMVDKLGYPHQLVQAIAIFIVGFFLYFIFNFFIFRKDDYLYVVPGDQ